MSSCLKNRARSGILCQLIIRQSFLDYFFCRVGRAEHKTIRDMYVESVFASH